MNKVARLAALSSILFCTTSFAEQPYEGAYLSLGVGASRTQNWKSNLGNADAGFKTGTNARLAVGHRFCDFKIEFEPSYIRLHRKADNNALGVSGHMRALSTLGNLYYHFPVSWQFFPYVGAGAGFSSIKMMTNQTVNQATVKTDNSATKFTYQGIAGFGFGLNDQTTLNIDYRYLQTEKLSPVEKAIRNHSINIGISYYF